MPAIDFPEVRERTSVIAFFLGMAIIAVSCLVGLSHALSIFVLVLSFFFTLLWRKSPRPWIFLVSILAATPIPMFRQQVAANLLCALWLVIFNVGYLSKLPKWAYVATGLAVIGVLTSSPNWMSGSIIHGIVRQSGSIFDYFLAPAIMLPVIYFRMSKSRDSAANLQGLLFCLIVPSTLLLFAAKWFGTAANVWEASLHVGSLPEGYIHYQLGRVLIDFGRTEVGFILAALICASTAIVFSPVKRSHRLLAGVCLVSNLVLLLATGSFGSGLACVCGLSAIFYAQSRSVNVTRVLASVIVIICMLFLTYSLSPSSTKQYLAKRYERRVTNVDEDRVELWSRAVDYLLQHPEGVGFTMTVGDTIKTNPHNDYLAYAVSYGVFGGLAYVSLVAGLLISLFRMRKRRIGDPSALAIYLAGLGVIVALAANSMTDHLGVNRWYFNIIWSIAWYGYFCTRGAQTGPVPERIKSEPAISGRKAYRRLTTEVKDS